MRNRLPESSRKKRGKKRDNYLFSSEEKGLVVPFFSTETPNERQLLIEALRRNGWNMVRTAESLHIAGAELSRMLRRCGLHDGL